MTVGLPALEGEPHPSGLGGRHAARWGSGACHRREESHYIDRVEVEGQTVADNSLLGFVA